MLNYCFGTSAKISFRNRFGIVAVLILFFAQDNGEKMYACEDNVCHSFHVLADAFVRMSRVVASVDS